MRSKSRHLLYRCRTLVANTKTMAKHDDDGVTTYLAKRKTNSTCGSWVYFVFLPTKSRALRHVRPLVLQTYRISSRMVLH